MEYLSWYCVLLIATYPYLIYALKEAKKDVDRFVDEVLKRSVIHTLIFCLMMFPWVPIIYGVSFWCWMFSGKEGRSE